MNKSHYKKIYFIGIKGVGMANLAIVAKEAGFDVAGSDVSEKFITDQELEKAKIIIFDEFSEEHVLKFIDSDMDSSLVITTAAHKGFDNPEAVWAKDHGVKVISYGQALGLFMDGEILEREISGISVAGAHGKTTTAALVAFALETLGVDPSFVVGTSAIFPLGYAGHYGQGKYFVAEADEYVSDLKYDKTPKFLYQNPKYAIITNIDFDHPDVYETIDEVLAAYQKFVQNIHDDGVLIISGDDDYSQKLISQITNSVKTITVGKSSTCDFSLSTFKEEGLSSQFVVNKNGQPFGKFSLSIPGFHNAINALSVIALLDHLGYTPQDLEDSLAGFTGTKRRLEKIGKMENGALLFDDYAHHPKEIEASLNALKNAYPEKKIMCIFQPHTYSRTISLLHEFQDILSKNCDQLVLLPIFSSQREQVTNEQQDEVEESFKKVIPEAVFLRDDESVVKYIDQNTDSDSLVVTMGAGDIYKISEKLKE